MKWDDAGASYHMQGKTVRYDATHQDRVVVVWIPGWSAFPRTEILDEISSLFPNQAQSRGAKVP